MSSIVLSKISYVDMKCGIIEVTHAGFGDRKQLRETPSPIFDSAGTNFDKGDILQRLRDARSVQRLGGGLPLGIVNENKELSAVGPIRTPGPDVPSPYAWDVPSGIPEATQEELQSGVFDSRLPQAVRLMGEGAEVILVKVGPDGKPTYLIPDFWSYGSFSEVQMQYLQNTYDVTINYYIITNKKYEYIKTPSKAELAKFDDGYTLVEKFGDNTSYTSENVAITFEPKERSMEVLWPLLQYVEGDKVLGSADGGFDGEITGSASIYDLGVFSSQKNPVKMLNRNVMLVHPDGEIELFNKGVRIWSGPAYRFIETEVKQLIEQGKTTGATSKVWELYKKALLDEHIVSNSGTKYPLTAYKVYIDELSKYLRK